MIEMPGSSPLTRGKHVIVNVHCPTRGLIPAHAGKTKAARAISRLPRAHPRSRGENRPKDRAQKIKLGSSPLTRGKLIAAIAMLVTYGLIPAHAGKTSPRGVSSVCPRAHPRSRGENFCMS